MARTDFDSTDDLQRAERWLLAYVIVLFVEGAVRKWILPSLSTPIFLLKDVLITCALVSFMRFRTLRTAIPLACILALFCFACLQLLILNSPITGWAVGARGVLSFPLVILVTYHLALRTSFQATVGRLVIVLSAAQLPLVLMQLAAAPSAPVNRLLAVDGSDNIGLAGAVVRPTGTFTSAAGLALAGSVALAFTLGHLLTQERPQVIDRLALPVLMALNVLLGSRTALLLTCALLVMFALLVGLGRGGGIPALRATAWTIGASALALVAVFATQGRFVQAFLARLQDTTSEDKSRRLIIDYLGWINSLGDATWIGNGMGASANFSVNTGVLAHADWVESDLARIVFECGFVVGALIVVGRLGAVAVLLARYPAWIASRSWAALLSVPAIPALASGPVLSQGTVGGIVAVTVGLIFGRQCDGTWKASGANLDTKFSPYIRRP